MNYNSSIYDLQPSTLICEHLSEYNKLNLQTKELMLNHYNDSDINFIKKKIMKDISEANENNCTAEKYRNLWNIKRFFDKHYKLPFHIRARIDEYNKLNEHARKLLLDKYSDPNIEKIINKLNVDYKREKYEDHYNYNDQLVKNLEELIKFFS